ncbi:hypothetical protein SELMODRAFT_425409 [Selaginella moellendorffii]|uniref:Uncharacterized protein n=1 Tax=Selaginella moellendorffii TaxID=88036 RepID=D8ST07_SELML|nr:hypothetical protein SELMODRAFT_425409 [Selaginella moellendorffii]
MYGNGLFDSLLLSLAPPLGVCPPAKTLAANSPFNIRLGGLFLTSFTRRVISRFFLVSCLSTNLSSIPLEQQSHRSLSPNGLPGEFSYQGYGMTEAWILWNDCEKCHCESDRS